MTVDYQSRLEGWNLTISDDGVGMSKNPGSAEPGLGTAIVKALANQLGASITVKDLAPGTKVSFLHLKASGEPAQLRAV